MTRAIVLAPRLRLTAEAVTQVFGILGSRGSGKTTTASVMIEGMLSAGYPVNIIDPLDVWWGLRSSKDGRDPGYSVTVLGGDHGDAPLEETAGRLIADLVAEEAPPLILSLRRFSKSAMRRFMIDYLERLYEKNRNALHVVFDEGDLFAPQRITPDSARLFGAIDDIVRRGRSSGLGVTMISQRSATINKDILSQCEVLIAHRASHPRDLDPILEWMQVHATKAQLVEVHDTIAKLADGEAWLMSPEWLKLFGRIQVNDRTTFNSSATPKAGERRIVPKKLAEVDLKLLQERMKETIERAKATDPKLLQKRIVELEAQVKAGVKEVIPTAAKTIEVSALKETHVTRLENATDKMKEAAADIVQSLKTVMNTGLRAQQQRALQAARAPQPVAAREIRTEQVLKARVDSGEVDSAPLPDGERKTLVCIAQHPQGVTRQQIITVTGYRKSTVNAYVSRLAAHTFPYVEVRGGVIVATPTGVAALGDDFEPLPTGAALRAILPQTLPEGEWKTLSILIEKYPEPVERPLLQELTGFTKSTVNAYLHRLQARKLADAQGRGLVAASANLF